MGWGPELCDLTNPSDDGFVFIFFNFILYTKFQICLLFLVGLGTVDLKQKSNSTSPNFQAVLPTDRLYVTSLANFYN